MAHDKSSKAQVPQIVAVRSVGGGVVHYIMTHAEGAIGQTLCGGGGLWRVVRGKAAVVVCEACQQAKDSPVVESEAAS